MRKNILIYVFGVLAVLMGCFFYTPEEVKAAEPQGAQIGVQRPALLQAAAHNRTDAAAWDEDIPDDVMKPLEKGKSFLSELVFFFGWVFIIFGIIFFGLSWISHQTDQRIIGITAAFIGALIAYGPQIADWLIS